MLWKLRAALISDPLIVLGTVIYGSLSMMASLFDKTGFTQHRIARVWARCSGWRGDAGWTSRR